VSAAATDEVDHERLGASVEKLLAQLEIIADAAQEIARLANEWRAAASGRARS
jgi:hypothetical protein